MDLDAELGPVPGAVQRALDGCLDDPRLRDLARTALGRRPYVLCQGGSLRAAPLVMGAFRCAGGAGDAGVQAAAAMEVLTTALHLFDGLADDEPENGSSDLQTAIALQFLTGYLLSAARCDGRPVDWAPVYRLLGMVAAGQQQDIDLQAVERPTLDDARDMTLRKTGAYGEALTVAGAIAAGAPRDVLEELARLGQFAGMQGQLLDDARDASPSAPGTSDIRLRKKTLPVAFFLQREDRVPEHDTLRRLYTTASALDAETEMAMRRAVEASGGLEVTTVLAGWYKMRAAEVLERLHKRGCDTSLLRAHLQMEDQAAAPPGAPSPA